MADKIGLFGGSFDPIHFGHLIVARSVAEQVALDRVIFLPSATPPHKSSDQLTDSAHREAMVRLAIDDEAGFAVSDFDLARAGPTYTVETVAHFRRTLGADVALHWIIGADSLADLHTWYHVDELVAQCDILTAARPGWERPPLDRLGQRLDATRFGQVVAGILATPWIDISSTDIRSRAAAGQSIRYLVPEAVRDYIAAHHLYGT
jgi:nicotinate-nucleotide adenylyltransferase